METSVISISSPILIRILFGAQGKIALGGFLAGATLCGVCLGLMMTNAGGAWDNAKKVVEVDLGEKGTPLHDATVIGDTVGDPFKDTSSVALNPIIKFTTLTREVVARVRQCKLF